MQTLSEKPPRWADALLALAAIALIILIRRARWIGFFLLAAALAPVAPQLVLQVPHHGSKTSSSAEFIAALHPALA